MKVERKLLWRRVTVNEPKYMLYVSQSIIANPWLSVRSMKQSDLKNKKQVLNSSSSFPAH